MHRAEQLIDRLGLAVLEGESGWWAPITRSSVEVTVARGDVQPASSTIYYLLSPDRPVNFWHRLDGDYERQTIRRGCRKGRELTGEQDDSIGTMAHDVIEMSPLAIQIAPRVREQDREAMLVRRLLDTPQDVEEKHSGLRHYDEDSPGLAAA